MSFATGRGFLVDLHSVVGADGKTRTIHHYDQRLSSRVTAFSLEAEFNEIKDLVFKNVHLMIILNDLTDALRSPNHATTCCARVVDGIRYAIAANEASRSKQWNQMQEALRVSEEYVRYVTDRAKQSRHNAPWSIDDAEAGEAVLRTWTITNRLLEYKKRGDLPLPLTEFPLLR
jgi:hypothetical protein